MIGMRLNPSAATVKGGGVTVPVHRLRVVKRLPLEGVCESVLHGMVSISPSPITNREGSVSSAQTEGCEAPATRGDL